jgi:hypothetical protein
MVSNLSFTGVYKEQQDIILAGWITNGLIVLMIFSNLFNLLFNIVGDLKKWNHTRKIEKQRIKLQLKRAL